MNTSEEEPGSLGEGYGRGIIKIIAVLKDQGHREGQCQSKDLQPLLNQRPPLQYPPPPSRPGQRGYRRPETGPDAQRLQNPDKG